MSNESYQLYPNLMLHEVYLGQTDLTDPVNWNHA